MTAAELGQAIIDACESQGITACEAADRLMSVTAEKLTMYRLEELHPVRANGNGNGRHHH